MALGIKISYAVVFIIIIGVVVGCVSCTDDTVEPEERPRDTVEYLDYLKEFDNSASAVEVNVDINTKYQVIDNFGASDSWSAQFVGNWEESKKSQIADWLFSIDTSVNGSPKGIGLSAWRFNIGAGSSEQGINSQIDDVWRRAECFLDVNGNYNWNKQAGQQWFLTAANQRGVETFIGYTNSPPVHLTKNGLAHGSPSDPENITSDKLNSFAEFLVDVTEGIKNRTGVEFDYISPFNEPQWDWTDNKQEGCYMRNQTSRALVNEINNALVINGSLNTRILISEAGEWDYLYSKGNTTGNQVDYFFGTDSPLNSAQYLEQIITGHSYYTTVPLSSMMSKREMVWNKVSSYPDLKVWCTEYCPLGDGDLAKLGWSNWKKDYSMHTALYVANIIHHDLTYANVSAWQWWLGISNSNYPDGLVYVDGSTTSGTINDSKILWILGNYSRFVRPGFYRVKVESLQQNLLSTAYIDEENKQLVIVVINKSESAQGIKFTGDTFDTNHMKPYITSDASHHNLFAMPKIDVNNAYEIPASSAVTFVGNLNN